VGVGGWGVGAGPPPPNPQSPIPNPQSPIPNLKILNADLEIKFCFIKLNTNYYFTMAKDK